MQRGICFLLIWFWLAPALKAQVPSRAQRFFNLAMIYEGRKEHDRARAKMEDAIRLYPQFTTAYSMLGEWYFKDQRYNLSADIFQRAYRNTPNGSTLFALPLAKSLIYAGRPEEALALGYQDSKEWKKLRDQAQFVLSARNHVWRDTVFSLGRTNTADAELFPHITPDEQKIYFTRRRNGSDEDFYYAWRDSCGGWFSARNMGSPPNTPDQEAAQMISADGHYLFFTKCENRSENGWEAGGCDLYMSYTADSIWSAPQNFGATINSPAFEGMPCLSPDNRELYFVSDRPGGFGGLDIWVSRFAEGLWQAPRNLGAEINTAGNETAPFLHIDNQTLYFASDGHPGFGHADLFIARRKNDTNWTKAVNMGAPINTAADESGLSVNFAGNRLYFSSDREGKRGNCDLYEMKLPAELQPKPVVTIKGYVYDSLSKQRLNHTSIFVKETYTGNPSYQFTSNRGDGSFMITLPAGRKYDWSIDRVSFMKREEEMNIPGELAGTEHAYTIPMLPDDYVEPVNDSLIATVQFPRNSAKLTEDDRARLRNAMRPWLEDPRGVMVFINGYTDNSGTPMINEELSYQRAGLVAREIMDMGWNEMSLKTQGWGEANPVAPNETEEGQSMNRRVEVVIRR